MHVRSRPISVSESAISRSVFESKALVASSCKRIRGAFSIHRAIATRCFSPPDSRRPRSPTLVSYPLSILSIVSLICANFAAFSTSSFEAPGLAYAML
mmetsp:Transcript_27714/g.108707  ORF Transcript_27714/g.108707 Transcript_27714/m.108707 type:complete len:98 (+) Transcript_27714:1226-1519(+)